MGSEMCIRDRYIAGWKLYEIGIDALEQHVFPVLDLYYTDPAQRLITSG